MSDPLRDRLAAALGPGYELQRLLGKGGMGSVYLARETSLDRLVAVKVLPPESTGDSETRERFRREARTAAKLTHPHIVPLYSFGEADGLLWFVMGYVAGETLASKLERTPRLDPEIVRRVLGEVADALDYAHSHGIVHRDVKPENILIEDAGGKALLADFGVARAGTGSTTLTTAGALVGTPLYMSPEQASGERDLDGRSDIYSLGIVGYRMLAGRTPFEGGDLRAVLAAHITQPAPALPDGVPDDLARAVTRALAKNPLERWASGRELSTATGSGGIITPDELDRLGGLPGFYSYAALMFVPAAIGIHLLGLLMPASEGLRAFREMLPFTALVIGLAGVALVYASTRRTGLRYLAATRIALWPPAGWTGPWPAAWRRPGDVWERLPAVIKRIRAGASIAAVLMLGLLTAMLQNAFRTSDGEAMSLYIALGILGMLAVQVTGFMALLRFGRQHGFDLEASARLIAKPTWNDPFWKKPEVARLLTAPTAARSGRDPATPADLAVEVKRVANALPSHHASLAQDAVQRSEEMARRIQRMDAELASLAAEVRQDDIDGVEKKLADLGPARPEEPEARRAIRAMHEQQLGVLRRLQAQLEEGQSHRDALAGMLRTLYLQVSELKIATARLTEADTSGVRAIIDRMGREVEGIREVGG